MGGPFTLQYSVSGPRGNYATNLNTLTVTAPITVPIDKVLEGTTIAGKNGTMPNMAARNPNGVGVGRSQALAFWTGGGPTVFLKPQKGYYDGNDTWTYFYEPNLLTSNIKTGVSLLGVTGNMSPGKRSMSMSFSYEAHPVKNPDLSFTVPNVDFTPFLVYANFNSHGYVNNQHNGNTHLDSVSNLNKGQMSAGFNHADFFLSFSMSGTDCNIKITSTAAFGLDRGNVTIYLFE